MIKGRRGPSAAASAKINILPGNIARKIFFLGIWNCADMRLELGLFRNPHNRIPARA